MRKDDAREQLRQAGHTIDSCTTGWLRCLTCGAAVFTVRGTYRVTDINRLPTCSTTRSDKDHAATHK